MTASRPYGPSSDQFYNDWDNHDAPETLPDGSPLIGPPGTGWCGTCNRRDVPMVRTEDDSVLAEHDGCPGAGDREYGWWHDEIDDWSHD